MQLLNSLVRMSNLRCPPLLPQAALEPRPLPWAPPAQGPLPRPFWAPPVQGPLPATRPPATSVLLLPTASGRRGRGRSRRLLALSSRRLLPLSRRLLARRRRGQRVRRRLVPRLLFFTLSCFTSVAGGRHLNKLGDLLKRFTDVPQAQRASGGLNSRVILQNSQNPASEIVDLLIC